MFTMRMCGRSELAIGFMTQRQWLYISTRNVFPRRRICFGGKWSFWKRWITRTASSWSARWSRHAESGFSFFHVARCRCASICRSIRNWTIKAEWGYYRRLLPRFVIFMKTISFSKPSTLIFPPSHNQPDTIQIQNGHPVISDFGLMFSIQAITDDLLF